MDIIQELWRDSGYPVPRILIAFHKGRRYLTVSDDSTVFTFASRNGVFAATKSKCIVAEVDGVQCYIIADSALQIVSCKTLYDPKEIFVVTYIYGDPRLRDIL